MVGADRNAWQQGFVTPYAMSESREDFVENIEIGRASCRERV